MITNINLSRKPYDDTWELVYIDDGKAVIMIGNYQDLLDFLRSRNPP